MNRAIREHDGYLWEALEQANADAYGRYLEALAIVEAEGRAYAHTQAAIRWVAKGVGFKAGEPHMTLRDERVTVSELVDALRGLGDGPTSRLQEFTTPSEALAYSARLQRETWRR